MGPHGGEEVISAVLTCWFGAFICHTPRFDKVPQSLNDSGFLWLLSMLHCWWCFFGRLWTVALSVNNRICGSLNSFLVGQPDTHEGDENDPSVSETEDQKPLKSLEIYQEEILGFQGNKASVDACSWLGLQQRVRNENYWEAVYKMGGQPLVRTRKKHIWTSAFSGNPHWKVMGTGQSEVYGPVQF